ncbi:hypothetical protein CEXT_748691 [Caerostris extrusa]|uniref:Uncharacterized protein n=1 Tax=Caerostris extrusa TaxID=172846 RepID=A0AAV4NHG6_CAEEX|nr:hypothetical protein CEXT_748691 [Caerostris extrusa]
MLNPTLPLVVDIAKWEEIYFSIECVKLNGKAKIKGRAVIKNVYDHQTGPCVPLQSCKILLENKTALLPVRCVTLVLKEGISFNDY